jgi:isoleucyl-tRNA synthetase
LVKAVDAAYDQYEPTRAGRLIQEFVTEELSNWYVRLCRRRFWKGDYGTDKMSAYQTLYRCLETVSILSAPIAPFFMDRLYSDLNKVTGRQAETSVHLAYFPQIDESLIDAELEQKMSIAQRLTSLVLGLRKQERLRVRQPLQKIMIPPMGADFERRVNDVAHLVLSEVNVKEIAFMDDDSILVKDIKPDFKKLGPRFGKDMKKLAALINGFGQEEIATLEKEGKISATLDTGIEVEILRDDVQISTHDIPGWLVTSDGELTLALDITLTDELKDEGYAREVVNRIQNLRKDSGLEVTDKIAIQIETSPIIEQAIKNNLNYICAETLAGSLDVVEKVEGNDVKLVEVETGVEARILLNKI